MSNPNLPSIADIRASTIILSPPDASTRVVRVHDRFAVKYGRTVSRLEAENLEFLSQSSDIPIPKYHGTLVEPGTGIIFIVTEYIDGQLLKDAWPSLSASEKQDVENQLRHFLQQLRQLGDPGYLGSVGRGRLADGVFWQPPAEVKQAVSGPFADEAELNDGIMLRLAESEPESHLTLLRALISETLHGHKTVFTHGDLQPKNILVQRILVAANDPFKIQIMVIDWETAGWYPSYWEYTTACQVNPQNSFWINEIDKFISPMPEELSMERTRQKYFGDI